MLTKSFASSSSLLDSSGVTNRIDKDTEVAKLIHEQITKPDLPNAQLRLVSKLWLDRFFDYTIFKREGKVVSG
jgi:predicted GTPase